jgi:hypothetical protein
MSVECVTLSFVLFLYCQAQVNVLDVHEHMTITSSFYKVQLTLMGWPFQEYFS